MKRRGEVGIQRSTKDLNLADSGMTAPATLTDLSADSAQFEPDVSNKIATDLI